MGESLFGTVNPGQTENVGSDDWLTQIQHKGDHIEIVDHGDHDNIPIHIVTRVDSSGDIDTEFK